LFIPFFSFYHDEIREGTRSFCQETMNSPK
jgi:hypothetical protein